MPLLWLPCPRTQGTTTNGDYLLPFKTGAFLAGKPVQPVILRYGKVGRAACAACAKACCLWHSGGCLLWSVWCLGSVRTPRLSAVPQGRVSLSWEMIPAPRHLFLVLCNPLHSVTCYEVRPVVVARRAGIGRADHLAHIWS